MAKVKLSLTNGELVEKPIITAFSVDAKNYLILDAENIGSMGLPIILVCKLEGSKVTKIADANEWQEAKNYLKGIIAGNSMNYIPVSPELAADEVYYTQLTLPVASFDVIKNAYTVVDESNQNVVDAPPVVDTPIPVADAPVAPESPVVPDVPTAPDAPVVPDIPVANDPTPVVDTPAMPDAPVIPDVPTVPDAPVVPDIPVANEQAPVVDTPVMPEIPGSPDVPVSEPVAEANNDIASTKEAFMQACENMFDALVTKFQDQSK